jgi:excisionase family DNA binding protein
MNDPPPLLPVTNSPWLTRDQAAAYAHVSPGTIRREVRARRLQCARVGGRRSMRFKRAWVDAWLEATHFWTAGCPRAA